jgi:hypothetical protein
MPTARDIMTRDVSCVREQDDLRCSPFQAGFRLGGRLVVRQIGPSRVPGWHGFRNPPCAPRRNPPGGRAGQAGGVRGTVSPRRMVRIWWRKPRRRASSTKCRSGERNTG